MQETGYKSGVRDSSWGVRSDGDAGKTWSAVDVASIGKLSMQRASDLLEVTLHNILNFTFILFH